MEDQIKAVRAMQDYIEEHLYENITLADLADQSGYSTFYSHRLFLYWLHITPAEYIRKLRLSKSALRLRDEDVKIADVAFDVGFQSVDGYQRAFYREFGCNPKEYAKAPTALYLFTPYGILSSKKRKEYSMDEQNVFVQVVEKPARNVIIKRGIKATDYYSYCEEVGCDVWGLLISMKSISGEPVCMWLPKKYVTQDTSEYVQGVEVSSDYAGEIPEGFDMIQLPACQYLMFQGEPFAEEDYEEAIEAIWRAEKKYDPSALGYVWDMENPRIQLEPRGERGYIEYLPIKHEGKSLTMIQTATTTMIQEQAKPELQGRVFGLFGAIYSGFLPLGMLVFGPMCDMIPMKWIMIGSGVLLILLGILVSQSKGMKIPQQQG